MFSRNQTQTTDQKKKRFCKWCRSRWDGSYEPSLDLRCFPFYYSWLSLSRPRLSRITAYLEVKILSLLKLENLTTGKKNIVEKGRNCSNFSPFPQYFQYISNFRSPITYIFVKCDCSNYFFLNSANLICRDTDISKYFRESLGFRDNESRLYFVTTLFAILFSIFVHVTSLIDTMDTYNFIDGRVHFRKLGVLENYE